MSCIDAHPLRKLFSPHYFCSGEASLLLWKVVEPDEIWFWIHVWCSSWPHDGCYPLFRLSFSCFYDQKSILTVPKSAQKKKSFKTASDIIIIIIAQI